MKDLNRLHQEKDEIKEQREAIKRALRIPGARVNGTLVIRRLANGRTEVMSIASFLNKFPGRI